MNQTMQSLGITVRLQANYETALARTIDALKAELPALVKAAVAEVAPEFDRQGVGSRNMVGSEPELTLDSDPVNFLLKKAGSVKSTDEWTDAEKAVINGIWNRYMTQGMVSLSNSDE